MRIGCVLLLVCAAATASADPHAISGFITSGNGEIKGTVTDAKGAPIAKAVVHIVSSSGAEQTVETDGKGRYQVQLRGGAYTHVFVDDPARVVGITSTPTGTEGVIELHEALPPAVMAKPLKKPDQILAYSEEAIDADTWTRAWLMLDINERGVVTHVKLLNAPGHGLDDIAVRGALALRFEPARDRAKKPVRSLVVWAFEWPAYWWMRNGKHLLSRLPGAVADVPCRRADQPRNWDRDCSKPDIAGSLKRPWRSK